MFGLVILIISFVCLFVYLLAYHKLFVVVQTIRYVHSKDYRLDKITKKNGLRGYVSQTNISFAFFRRIVTNRNNISLSRKKVKEEKGSFSYSPIYHPVDWINITHYFRDTPMSCRRLHNSCIINMRIRACFNQADANNVKSKVKRLFKSHSMKRSALSYRAFSRELFFSGKSLRSSEE